MSFEVSSSYVIITCLDVVIIRVIPVYFERSICCFHRNEDGCIWSSWCWKRSDSLTPTTFWHSFYSSRKTSPLSNFSLMDIDHKFDSLLENMFLKNPKRQLLVFPSIFPCLSLLCNLLPVPWSKLQNGWADHYRDRGRSNGGGYHSADRADRTDGVRCHFYFEDHGSMPASHLQSEIGAYIF